jgi:ferredoxin
VVKETAKYFGADKLFDGVDGPEGASGLARVPAALHDDVIESAEECPGECIMIEPYDASKVNA